MNANKKFLVVCKANHCRSPVAEHLLSSICKRKDIQFSSAGLIDFFATDMHKLSREYLKIQGINPTLSPSKIITTKDLDSSTKVFALDFEIYMNLHNKYQKFSKKIHLFTAESNKQNIQDPIGMSREKYFEVMESIRVNSELIVRANSIE